MAGRVERNTTIEGQVAHRVCSRVLGIRHGSSWWVSVHSYGGCV